MSEVRIGTSGWSYPRGAGTWNGIFYPAGPAGRGRGAKFDELAFYAEHFNTVEINSTFYRVPTADTSRSWVERTPTDFEFSLKLFQKFTLTPSQDVLKGHTNGVRHYTRTQRCAC